MNALNGYLLYLLYYIYILQIIIRKELKDFARKLDFRDVKL